MSGKEEFNKALTYMKRKYAEMPPGGYKAHIHLIISRMVEVQDELMKNLDD